ncbi:PREDICTED: F-box/LRR-repeat protein 13-like [Amphimedon queenslandica]|uniref:F-box domain-containing protein n=1 Tax=Amphimedon queenslandica TaxID=400682 RepID=A0A1X7UWP7_AMPQE|nr:PREDICTED: F-box/LRR-repeat protein 13-like [Amphimedon queenslandica]|eukprot:XP_019851981.1 PREDICTED: F-box/LRR-repeat protein 13-like [Amphimedon queenslandica]
MARERNLTNSSSQEVALHEGMQSLVSLEGYSPELRKYLEGHKWPSVMEALFSGLAVMVPRDPWVFIENKLQEVHSSQTSYPTDIEWDCFIDPDLKPVRSFFQGIRDPYMDDTDLPSESLLEVAFDFRRRKLYGLCFYGWIRFHELIKFERAEEKRKTSFAEGHHRSRLKRIILTKWHKYAVLKSHRREKAMAVMNNVFQFHAKKRIFKAWLTDTVESRKANLFFQNRGRTEGEGEEEDWFYPDGQDPISLLPLDIAIKIFSYLGVPSVCRCAQVCRAWKDMSEDARLWNKVDLSPIGHYLTDSSLLQLFNKWRPFLGHLSLQKCVLLTSDSFKYIGQCQNLQDLNLSECQGITDEAIKSIAISCSGLFYLNLSYCYVTDSIIRLLTKYCRSLNYLSLSNCTQFTGKGLQSILAGEGCRKLVYLDLSACVQLSTEALLFIGQGCPILHTLTLDDITDLVDESIINFVTHCHTLRHFSLLGSSSLTDRAFKHLALENRKLKTFKVENNDHISDLSLRALAKSCRDLQVVYLAGCTKISDQGLKSLGHLKKIHSLNLADCSRVSDAGVRYIVEHNSGPVLRELNLTNCAKISDVTPLRIAQHCRNLMYLNLSFCEHISDTGVELLTQLSNLVDLDVTGCSLTDLGVIALGQNKKLMHLGLSEVDVTDDAIIKMAKGLNNLQIINLSCCEALTDACVQALAFNCQLLIKVYLAACPHLGDSTAKYLAQGCTWVQHIDLSGTSITDQALRHLGKSCHHLTQLDILSCVHVTKEAVVKLQKICPSVNYNTDPPQYNMPAREDMPELPMESLLNRL